MAPTLPATAAPAGSAGVPTRTPTPTATPVPTATPAPAATAASPSAPGTPSAGRRLADAAWAYLAELTGEYSPRESATAQEARAAGYLANAFLKLGYETALQGFEVSLLAADPPVLQVDHALAPAIDALPLNLSAEATTAGELVDAGMMLEDPPAGSLDGKVALIERGVIPFEFKVARVALAGAVAAVIYNNQPGPFRGTLATRPEIPAVSISQESGHELLKLIETGAVTARISVRRETRQSRNVVAVKAGSDPARGSVVLGGHFDTVPDVPGANDNGSGIATMLAVAEAIRDLSYPFAVRFIAFGSEEIGLEGSRHYISVLPEEERRAIIAMLNFDALGTGSSAGVFGSPGLVERATASAEAMGLSLSHEPDIQGGASDFQPFEDAGVPVLFFLADDFSRIHTQEDSLAFVDRELLGTAAAIAVRLLRDLE